MNNTERIKNNNKKEKVKELIKNTLIIFVGKISTQFLSFLLLPLYTFYIDTSEYGYVDLITTYISLLVTIVIVQLDMAAFRFLLDYKNSEDGKIRVISNIFICVTILNLIFVLIYIFVSNYLLEIQYKWLVLLIIIANIFSSVLLQIARGFGKNIDYSISSIVSGITTIILNIVLIIKYRLGGLGLLISMLVASLVTSLYLIFRLRIFKMISLKYIDKKITKDLFKYSIPLVPNQLSLWLVNVSDRTIIITIIGTTENGIYSIANKFAVILNSVYNFFYLAWSEQATLYFKENDKDDYFSLIINNVIKIFGTGCMIIITVMPLIFNVLINQTYNDAYYQIPILLLGTLFNIVVGTIGVIYVAQKKSNELAKSSIIAAIINILINILFIKDFGLYAASISTFIAYFIVMMYRWFDMKKYVNIKLENSKILILILYLIVSLYLYYINAFSTNIINFVVSIIIAIYINKKMIFLLLIKFKSFINNKIKEN